MNILPLLVASLLVTPALASDYEYLLDDIETLETEINSLSQAKTYLEADKNYEASPELFPRGEQLVEPAPGEIRTDSVSDTHVYVRVDGVPVVLQDVPLTEWFAPYVRNVGDLGIMSGYKDTDDTPTGIFGPGDSVTIAQLAKIATEASTTDPSSCPEEVANTSASGSWAMPYIACAESLRWSIFIDSSLDINRPATRAEVVTTIVEAFGVEILAGTGEVFTDVSSTFIFRGAIETAFADGIVSGYKDADGKDTNLFGPFNKINRAEIAKVVSLAVQIYGK